MNTLEVLTLVFIIFTALTYIDITKNKSGYFLYHQEIAMFIAYYKFPGQLGHRQSFVASVLIINYSLVFFK